MSTVKSQFAQSAFKRLDILNQRIEMDYAEAMRVLNPAFSPDYSRGQNDLLRISHANRANEAIFIGIEKDLAAYKNLPKTLTAKFDAARKRKIAVKGLTTKAQNKLSANLKK